MTTTIVAPEHAPLFAIATLAPGEMVTIYLRDTPDGAHKSWHGEILAIDVTGVRIAAAWARFDREARAERGEWVFPWANVDSVEIAGAPK
jgi:hypothetical protein